MTVFELRIPAAIISRACQALPGQDVGDLVRSMWQFLVVRRPDLTLAIWQDMILAAGSEQGTSSQPGVLNQLARPGESEALTLQTAEGPSSLRAVICRPAAIPPYVIAGFDDPCYGERFVAYERRAGRWIMAGTMLAREEAEAWIPGSEEAGGAPVSEVAAWLDHLIAAATASGQAGGVLTKPGFPSIHENAGPDDAASVQVAGVLVLAYIDTDTGMLVVSLDLDTAIPDLLDSAGSVPMQITVQGITVFDSAAGRTTPWRHRDL